MSTFHRPTSIDFRQNASFSVHNAVQMSKNSHTHLRNRMFYAEKLTRTVQNLTNCYFYTEPTGTLSTKNVQKTKNRKYRPNCFKKLYWVLKRVLSTKNGKGQACRFAAHMIRMFQQGCRRQALNHALVFLDLREAFYSRPPERG